MVSITSYAGIRRSRIQNRLRGYAEPQALGSNERRRRRASFLRNQSAHPFFRCYCPCRLFLLCCRRECPAPMTAPAAALPAAAPTTAPAAAPLALLPVPTWLFFCCCVCFCCWAGGVCVAAGGVPGFAGCVWADAWGTITGVTAHASTNDITFAERFIWPSFRPLLFRSAIPTRHAARR